MGNVVIKDEVAVIHSGVTEGSSISETLEGSAHFPPWW